MKIPIIKESALEYWLDGTDRYYYHSPELHSIASKFDFKIDETFAKNLSKEYNLTLPLHLMVPETHHRIHTENTNLYTWMKNIPDNSFLHLKDRANDDENIFISNPELTFFIACNSYTLPEAVLIGNILCATYVFDNDSAIKQREREPATTGKKIKRYLDKMNNVKGVRKAKKAASYIVDRCNSLREAELAAIAVLPIKYGGYGAPSFEMNGAVHVKKEYLKGLGRNILRCDFVWAQEKIVVEYESDMTHLEKEQHYYDKRRSTALTGSGYKAIYITNADVNSFSKIDETFFMIRKMLHQDRQQKIFDKYFDIRYESYNIIFRKNHVQELINKKYS